MTLGVFVSFVSISIPFSVSVAIFYCRNSDLFKAEPKTKSKSIVTVTHTHTQPHQTNKQTHTHTHSEMKMILAKKSSVACSLNRRIILLESSRGTISGDPKAFVSSFKVNIKHIIPSNVERL